MSLASPSLLPSTASISSTTTSFSASKTTATTAALQNLPTRRRPAPPSRPKKKRHTEEEEEEEAEDEEDYSSEEPMVDHNNYHYHHRRRHSHNEEEVTDDPDGLFDRNDRNLHHDHLHPPAARRKIPFVPSIHNTNINNKNNNKDQDDVDLKTDTTTATSERDAPDPKATNPENTGTIPTTTKPPSPAVTALFRPPTNGDSGLPQSDTDTTRNGRRTTRLQHQKRQSDLWKHVSQLSPAEQVPVYWQLVYGGNHEAISLSSSSSSKTTPTIAVSAYSSHRRPPKIPTRGVLKKPTPPSLSILTQRQQNSQSHKRRRPDSGHDEGGTDENDDEEATMDAWASPPTAGSPASPQWSTPQMDQAPLLVLHHPAAGGAHSQPSSATSRTSTRSVQFGPSQACTFDGTAAVAGSLQPMPDSATRYAVDNDDKMNDEVDGDENSPVSLAETKANAAELASWDGFLPSDDIAHHHHRRKSLSNQRSVDKEDGDNYDDDDTFIISQPTLRRRRRRSSTLFSRSSKSLLQDAETNLVNAEHNEPSDSEDEDEETVESYLPPLIPNPSNSMDPVDSLVLSDLTVHSPTLVEKPAASSVADVDSTDILTTNHVDTSMEVDSTTAKMDDDAPVNASSVDAEDQTNNMVKMHGDADNEQLDMCSEETDSKSLQNFDTHPPVEVGPFDIESTMDDSSPVPSLGKQFDDRHEPDALQPSVRHSISQSPSSENDESDHEINGTAMLEDFDSPQLTAFHDETTGETTRNERRRSIISPSQSDTETMEECAQQPSLQEREFSWQQLIIPKIPSQQSIFCLLQSNPPLQLLLVEAVEMIEFPESPRIPGWAPYRQIRAELDLWEDLLRLVNGLAQEIFDSTQTDLEQLCEAADSIRPPSRRLQISQLQEDIELIEHEIAREAEELARTRHRFLTAKLRSQESELSKWQALSLFLANVDLPNADETSPAGFCFTFPIPLLGSIVVLRPNFDITTDSASLDEVVSVEDLQVELPVDVVVFFRRLVSNQLSSLLELTDFEQVARRLATFLGRLDRSLDDLQRACRMWQYVSSLSTEEENCSLTLSFQFENPKGMTARLIWETTSCNTFVYLFPSQVELAKLNTEPLSLEVNCHPPTLSQLWGLVVGNTDAEQDG